MCLKGVGHKPERPSGPSGKQYDHRPGVWRHVGEEIRTLVTSPVLQLASDLSEAGKPSAKSSEPMLKTGDSEKTKPPISLKTKDWALGESGTKPPLGSHEAVGSKQQAEGGSELLMVNPLS